MSPQDIYTLPVRTGAALQRASNPVPPKESYTLKRISASSLSEIIFRERCCGNTSGPVGLAFYYGGQIPRRALPQRAPAEHPDVPSATELVSQLLWSRQSPTIVKA